MSEVYNSLHLLGYKIKEFSNDYFVTQRPDDIQTLFRNDGTVVKGNLGRIIQISDKAYVGVNSANEVILFDSEANIIDSAEYVRSPLGNRYGVYANMVIFSKDVDIGISIYSTKLDTKFEIRGDAIELFRGASPCKIINHNGKYKIAMFNSSGILHLVDSDNNVDCNGTEKSLFRSINNKYIARYNTSERDRMIATDFNGKEVCTSQYVHINTCNPNSDLIAGYSSGYITIIDISTKVKTSIKVNADVIRISFTSNPNIITVADLAGQYLINTKLLTQSQYYHRIYTMASLVVSNRRCYKINLNTFEIEEEVFKGFTRMRRINNMLQVCYDNGTIKYYTFDLQPLIHEFD